MMKRSGHVSFLPLLLVGVLVSHCGPRRVQPTLPAKSVLVPNKVLIFTHGYMSDTQAQAGLVRAFSQDGVPAPEGSDGIPRRYHAHSFDYSAFTRAGSDHNTSQDALARAFADFFHELPDHCPICRSWRDTSVDAILIAHSFGGLIIREFLQEDVERGHAPFRSAAKADGHPRHWRISRVITLGTPWYGSLKTHLTTGFQSIIVNGIIRTLLLGFVHPEAGGTFGRVIDAQLSALRVGSPYLWRSFEEWKTLLEHGDPDTHLPWLVVAGVGGPEPEREGDGITRFSSANLAATLPEAHIETLIVDLPHALLVRLSRVRAIADEQRFMIAAMSTFIERGTLLDAPAARFTPWKMVRFSPPRNQETHEDASEEERQRPPRPSGGGKLHLLPLSAPDPASRKGDVPPFFLRGTNAADTNPLQWGNAFKHLGRILDADLGDVWLRFYAGFPRDNSLTAPRLIALSPALSFFRTGLEPSRERAELVPLFERSVDGLRIPVTYQMRPLRGHMIAIPDVTPSGIYRLRIRVSRHLWLRRRDLRIENNGRPENPCREETKPIPPTQDGALISIHPAQANLIKIYIDVDAVLAHHPDLRTFEIREVELERAVPPPPSGR